MSTDAATGFGAAITAGGRTARAERSMLSWSTARVAVTIALIVAVTGLVATVGADARWLAALGRIIIARRAIPTGVPFAAAPTGHWQNTLVLAELVFDALERGLGDRGLILAQLVAIALALSILARDARAGGGDSKATATALMLAGAGALSSLAIVRVQLFSLVLFAALVALLRAQARTRSRRIWLALPLLALWSNLHGAALLGLAVLYPYLALSRFRHERLTSVAMAGGALVALSLTPAGIHTIDYYHGLVTNLAAQRGVGQWAPLGHSPLDWLAVAAAIVLALRLRHRVPAPWELVVLAVLACVTVKAARDSVWLLLFLVGPASHHTRIRRDWNGLIPVGAAVALAALAFDVAGPPHSGGASRAMVDRALALAHGRPILADGIPAEQLALAGGRIWAGNPLDAFSRSVQAAYLDWVDGDAGGRAALDASGARVVLVTRASDAARLTAADPAFVRAADDRSAVIYLRRAPGGPDR